jgi:single-strand DNA-binding protein
MASVNKVILIGNLGADPELRYTSGGQAVADLRVATSRRWQGKDGSQQEDTQWHRVVVWGKTAEQCKEYLSKGRQAYIEGRLQTRSWEDRDGNKRYTTEVVAQQVLFLGGRGSPGASSEPPPPSDQSMPSDLGDDDIPF